MRLWLLLLAVGTVAADDDGGGSYNSNPCNGGVWGYGNKCPAKSTCIRDSRERLGYKCKCFRGYKATKSRRCVLATKQGSANRHNEYEDVGYCLASYKRARPVDDQAGCTKVEKIDTHKRESVSIRQCQYSCLATANCDYSVLDKDENECTICINNDVGMGKDDAGQEENAVVDMEHEGGYFTFVRRSCAGTCCFQSGVRLAKWRPKPSERYKLSTPTACCAYCRLNKRCESAFYDPNPESKYDCFIYYYKLRSTNLVSSESSSSSDSGAPATPPATPGPVLTGIYISKANLKYKKRNSPTCHLIRPKGREPSSSSSSDSSTADAGDAP